MRFRQFLENQEEDLKESLKKLPKRHRALIKGYSINFQGSNGLKGDSKHVGVIDEKKKSITISAPWRYGREFTLFHEIAHMVWERLVDRPTQKRWHEIVKQTKGKKNENVEEMFCMAYANNYVKHKVVSYHYPEWEAFIKNLPK